MKHLSEYRDAKLVRALVDKICGLEPPACNLMEVCGTHTMAIARYGLRDLMPDGLNLISGPGCPVCVTDRKYIDQAIAYARLENFLTSIGRNKFLRPLYQDLMDAGKADMAARIFEAAKPGYHPLTVKRNSQIIYAESAE